MQWDPNTLNKVTFTFIISRIIFVKKKFSCFAKVKTLKELTSINRNAKLFLYDFDAKNRNKIFLKAWWYLLISIFINIKQASKKKKRKNLNRNVMLVSNCIAFKNVFFVCLGYSFNFLMKQTIRITLQVLS